MTCSISHENQRYSTVQHQWRSPCCHGTQIPMAEKVNRFLLVESRVKSRQISEIPHFLNIYNPFQDPQSSLAVEFVAFSDRLTDPYLSYHYFSYFDFSYEKSQSIISLKTSHMYQIIFYPFPHTVVEEILHQLETMSNNEALCA